MKRPILAGRRQIHLALLVLAYALTALPLA
jgi:hypothetical protein